MQMFFAKLGKYQPCGILSFEHIILLLITVLTIKVAIQKTNLKDLNEIKRKIRNVTIVVWVLEIIKIIFNLLTGNANNINTYIPLYYCSILLYAGIFSSIGKGIIKKVGDVFLATGAIVGGSVFLILPTTSITMYPAFHYISIQSFIYHGAMIYLGIIVNKSNYVEIKNKDIIYYAGLIMTVCVIAYVVNCIFGSNLMFISKDFPKTPITIIYHLTKSYFPIVMSAVQATLPFYAVLYGKKHLEKQGAKEQEEIVYQISN